MRGAARSYGEQVRGAKAMAAAEGEKLFNAEVETAEHSQA